MPVPTHKSGCETLHFRPARCNTCSQVVTYWACSCGARVLFDAVGKPWPKHRCGDPSNVKFMSTYTYGVSSVVCMRCGKTVRKRELDLHNYYTHGIGERPSDPTKQEPGKGKKISKRPTVICEVCRQSVRKSRLEKHMRKAHPGTLSTSAPQVRRNALPAGHKLPNGTVSTKPVTECEVCSIPVRIDKLEEHRRRVHPAHAARNNIQRGGRR